MHKTTRGTLVTWKADKAFGFIRPDEGGKDVFVHQRDFGRIARSPRVGDIVTFQRMSDGAGRLRAADVSIQGLERQTFQARSSATLAPQKWHLLLALSSFMVLAVLVARNRLPLVVPGWCLIASLAAFVMYALDKSAAMNRRWRTSESALLLAGLLGGWPGALVAQGMFRHKSTKASFQAAFWLTVIADCAVLAWWSFR